MALIAAVFLRPPLLRWAGLCPFVCACFLFFVFGRMHPSLDVPSSSPSLASDVTIRQQECVRPTVAQTRIGLHRRLNPICLCLAPCLVRSPSLACIPPIIVFLCCVLCTVRPILPRVPRAPLFQIVPHHHIPSVFEYVFECYQFACTSC
jgi:hypothetical protein